MARLTILHTSDLHTQIAPMQRLATVAKQTRDEAREVLVLDSGDTYADGDPETQLLMLKLVQLLGYDAMTRGDGDIPLWDRFSLDQMADLPFALFAPGLPCQLLHDRSGVRVGIVGAPADASLAQVVQSSRELRGKCDLLVALTHIGLDADVELAKSGGLDIVLGGHHHKVLDPPLLVGDCVICQHGGHGRYVGRIDVELDEARHVPWQVSDYVCTDLRNVQADGELRNVVFQEEVTISGVGMLLRAPIGRSNQAFSGENTDWTTLLGESVAQAILEVAETDVALMLTRSMSSYLPQGIIRVIDAYDVVYQNLEIMTWKLPGLLLKTLVDQSTAPDPWGHPRRFYAAGLTLDYLQPSGDRIMDPRSHRPLGDEAYYTVATDSFAGSGHHFPLFKQAPPARHTSVGTREALVRYVQRHGSIPV